LVSQLRKNLLLCSSHPPLGFPTGSSTQTHQQVFWRHCRGLNKKKKLPRQPRASKQHKFSGAVAREKEDFGKGSLSLPIFYLLLFCFILFLLS
jgi:hypothetical protein